MPVTDKKTELIVTFTTAISNCALYSSEHAIVGSLAEKIVSLLNDLMSGKESLGVMIVANELVFDSDPFRNKSLHVQNFIKNIKKKGVNKLVFSAGVPPAEIVKLVGDIASPSAVVSSYPHITTGLVEIRYGSGDGEGMALDELQKFQSEQIDKVKGVFGGVSRFKKLDVTGLEDIVINFIAVLHRESNILHMMTPVKSYSEFTYMHATNVAILSMFQAEALGVKGEYLHDIGMAALLHDVGKMFVSREILEKKGKLDDREWEEMKKHTVYGAKYLIGIDDVPKIAVPVALEHHMRYDGTGYPQTKHVAHRQHLCSQIVALSDCYDALRAKRPYKTNFAIHEILAVLREESGKQFNPLLLDSFIRGLNNTAPREGSGPR